MEKERRVSTRVHIEIPVNVTDGATTKTLRAVDISTRGMFIKTDAPPPLRRIIRLNIPTGERSPDLQVLAMVVHRLLPEQAKAAGTAPGMGVQLYGLGNVARDQWQKWFQTLATTHALPDPAERKGPPPLVLPGKVPVPTDAVNRNHVRYAIAMDVQFIGDNVEKGRTIDVSLGGAFVSGIKLAKVGQEVSLVFIHPISGEGFDLSAKIVRVDSTSLAGGAGVLFTALTPQRRQAWQDFLHAALPFDEQCDDALTVIDPNDPMLA